MPLFDTHAHLHFPELLAELDAVLERARAAVQQANEVVQISDVAFREGATTNIEVVDAQRRALGVLLPGEAGYDALEGDDGP